MHERVQGRTAPLAPLCSNLFDVCCVRNARMVIVVHAAGCIRTCTVQTIGTRSADAPARCMCVRLSDETAINPRETDPDTAGSMLITVLKENGCGMERIVHAQDTTQLRMILSTDDID